MLWEKLSAKVEYVKPGTVRGHLFKEKQSYPPTTGVYKSVVAV